MDDLISRRDAIDALKICDSNEEGVNCHKCPLRDTRWDGAWYDEETTCYTKLMRDSAKLLDLPSAQPDISDDGTLMITVPNGMLNDVKRVLVDEVGTKFCKTMYQDDPERKKGEWLLNKEECAGEGFFICSVCGGDEYDARDFCPNCGADMKGEQNEIN